MPARSSNEEFGANTAEFKKHACFNPTCVYFRRFINLMGAFLSLFNAGIDIAYVYRTTYVLKLIFTITCAFLVIRIVITLLIGQYYYTKFVRNYRPGMSEGAENRNDDQADHEDDEDESGSGVNKSQKFQNLKKNGVNLYSALHLLLYTGFFRLLPSKDFAPELGVGYALELFLAMIPMLFGQVLTNAATDELSNLQSIAVLFKLIALLTLILELGLMIFEIRLNRSMSKLGISGYKKASED